MRDRGLIIEFFGTPGAGKTHVARAVAEYQRRDGDARVLMLRDKVCPRRFSGEWLRSGLGARAWMVRHPLYFARLLSAIRGTKQASFRQSWRLSMGWVKTQARIDRFRRAYDIIVQDHGSFQALWSIAYGAAPGRWIQKLKQFIGLIRPPDLLVVVNTDQGTLVRRLEERRRAEGPTSRIQNEDLACPEVQKHMVELTTRIMDSVISPLELSGRLQTHRFNNDSDLDHKSITHLAESISGLRQKH